MKSPLIKSALREIKGSMGRFLSIFFITALGVSFFAGVNVAAPDMRITADKYFDDYNFMDIRLVSTLGFNDDDIESIKELDGVKEVMPSYTMDAIYATEKNKNVLRLQSIPIGSNEYINMPRLVEGRMPEKSGECVVENAKFGHGVVFLGDKISLQSGNDKEISESLNTSDFTVVGVVESPQYITSQKESSTIGNGTVAQYVLIPEEDFKLPVYTDAYITIEGAKELLTYNDEYKELIYGYKSNLESLGDERAGVRYDEIVNEANSKLEDSRAEYEEKKSFAECELNNALNELEDGSLSLDNAEKEIDKKEEMFNKEMSDAKKRLSDAEVDYKIGKAQYETQLSIFNTNKKELESKLSAYEKAKEDADKLLDQQKDKLAELKKELENPELTEIERKTIASQIENLEKAIEYENRILDEAEAEIDGIKAQLDDAENQLIEAKANLDKGKAELEYQKNMIDEKEISVQASIDSGREEIQNKRIQLENGRAEYEKKKKETEAQLKDGEDELKRAEDEINSISQPSWYILDRNMNYGYVNYDQSADSITNIARIFPLFFFIVSALVCLTTMTRMVDEERIDIGTMKALGYEKKAIVSKYILYGALASIGGSILGITVGFVLFPTVIFNAYGIMFALPKVKLTFNWFYAVISTAAAVLITTLSAFTACYSALIETPSLLMIPKAPKLGKRILLERISFIWKRLKFTQKVTARNIFRYKKKFFMTTIGIAGCTALILAGFGIRDSIRAIVTTQFGQLIKYDMTVSLDSNIKTLEKENIEKYMNTDDRISDSMLIEDSSVEVSYGNISKDITLVVPEDVERYKDFNCLRNRVSHKEVKLQEGGVIITEKASKELEVKTGDTISIKNKNNKMATAVITGISENYISHYIYMTKDTYENLFSSEFDGNKIISSISDTSDEIQDGISEEIMQQEGVSSVAFNSNIKKVYNDTIKSLNYVVIVMISAAGALAFVVLYNLTNVNISERVREIATIKVLGFYDKEVSAYVYKENIILTILGIIVGLVVGIFLHRFIMNTAELQDVMFGRNIEPASFIMAAVITMIFAVFVNWVMYYKLKSIKMVESLKSVE